MAIHAALDGQSYHQSVPPTSVPPKRLCDFLVGLGARKSDIAEHTLVKRSEHSAAGVATTPLPQRAKHSTGSTIEHAK